METFKIGSSLDSSSNYLSPHVRSIASLVYSEFEHLVSRYGEGVVDGIVPIIIRALDQVDQLHESNELLRTTIVQNEQEMDSLTNRLEREIKARRSAEEQVITLEDEIDEVRLQTNKKIADYTKLIRVLEAKFDAANELVARQEAKEAELRHDLAKAQQRSQDLICSHLAHIERTRSRVRSGTFEKPSSDLNKFASDERLSQAEEISKNKSGYSNRDIQGDSKILPPLTGSDLAATNRLLDEELFDALNEAKDYEEYLNEPTLTQPLSEEFDDVSKVSDGCEFVGSESLEAEVVKLLAENQDLTDMKNALNILKDDLLSRIDDLSGINIVLENDLTACCEQLVSERTSAKLRERQLTQRIQELSSRLWVAERLLENLRTGAIVKCASERRLHESPNVSHILSHRRRTRSSEAIITAVSAVSTSNESAWRKQSENKSTKETVTGTSNGLSANGSRNEGTLRLTKRQIARIIVERNYYKEHYFEAQDRLNAMETAVQAQTEMPQHFRKRDMARALVSGIFHSVRKLADDVAQDVGELLMPNIEAWPSPPQPSQTSTALWNILGNFVGQAVTYTADAVMGTGSDLPLDVSRPMIAARVNSKLSIAPGTEEQLTSRSYPMYTDHSI